LVSGREAECRPATPFETDRRRSTKPGRGLAKVLNWLRGNLPFVFAVCAAIGRQSEVAGPDRAAQTEGEALAGGFDAHLEQPANGPAATRTANRFAVFPSTRSPLRGRPRFLSRKARILPPPPGLPCSSTDPSPRAECRAASRNGRVCQESSAQCETNSRIDPPNDSI
jgi:hypothetical protein